jgi:outer membrane protein OmpA-like peptidoglycan-associated protein
MPLPTTLNLSLDYNVWKSFYVSAGARIAFFQGTKIYSKASEINNYYINPRWETKYIGIQAPISYNQYKEMNFGLGARLGPIFIGSSDLLGILGLKDEIGGLGFYVAAKIPIYYKAPKDGDKDNVSNKYDDCPKEKGSWDNRGCPDSDGDGIINKDDDCPYTAGLPEFKGCPDTDGDGIQDKYDDCPEVYGEKIYRGCPDSDGDGVIDKLDSCVNIPGLAEFNGCPDTDEDGIPNHLDDCPNLAGLEEFVGCPDTDGDGIQDKYDECPQTFGPIENGGCPYADTDGDSVFDKDDDCPMTPGTVANNGCPEIEEEEQEVLNTVFNNLQFQSGKAVIMESSFQSLDDLANLLIKKADFKLLIEGHTDDVGREMANMSLSQNRVMAVKNYLVSKGIDEKRFVTKWYGESNPIAPNDTEEGRAKNRRVELNVVFD